METITPSWGVFVAVTVLVMGFAAYMTGQALANTWKPLWHAVIYAVLMGFADRFLVFALFDGSLSSVLGYIVDTTVLVAISVFAFRSTQARKMVSQYPWLYERRGLFTWKSRVTQHDRPR